MLEKGVPIKSAAEYYAPSSGSPGVLPMESGVPTATLHWLN